MNSCKVDKNELFIIKDRHTKLKSGKFGRVSSKQEKSSGNESTDDGQNIVVASSKSSKKNGGSVFSVDNVLSCRTYDCLYGKSSKRMLASHRKI